MGVEVDLETGNDRVKSPGSQSILFGEIPVGDDAQLLVNNIIKKVQENEHSSDSDIKNHNNSPTHHRNGIDQPAIINIESDGKPTYSIIISSS